MTMILEVCSGDIAGVEAAARGGAARVELCSALDCGGLTRSAGMIAEALRVPGLRVHVLIRPREGDFVYSRREVDVMLSDIAEARRLGAHGVAVGALTADGAVDVEAMRQVVDAASGMQLTFHRAFDRVADADAALRQLIELGFHRVLTSGCAPSAYEGMPMLRHLRQSGAGRIKILAGAGINADNAAAVAAVADELHASARAPLASAPAPAVKMGAADNGVRMVTSYELVKQIAQCISNL